MIETVLLAMLPIVPAFLTDLVVGDPIWLYHPVRIIGTVIAFMEKSLRALLPKTKEWELVGGGILAVAIPTLFFLITGFILMLIAKASVMVALAIDVFWCYQMFASKSLKTESDKVKTALENGEIPLARKCLSYIVGRDTANLNQSEIVKATVETIAENTSDGITAPMIFAAIGGAPLCFFYKAVNTLDSMVGYRNEKYEYFGKSSAKLDDVLNYIPARFCALTMIIGAFFCKLNYGGAYKTYLRDRKNHPSPNSAQTEAVCAGALGIQLGGGGYYGGIFKGKETIGDETRQVTIEAINEAQGLMLVSSVIGVVIITVIKLVVLLIIRSGV